MAPTVSARETLVTLYFASMGVTPLGISRLLFHEFNVDRGESLIYQRVWKFKKMDELYDRYRREWLLEGVGKYLAQDRLQPYGNHAVIFEDIIRFRRTERRVVGDEEVGHLFAAFILFPGVLILSSYGRRESTILKRALIALRLHTIIIAHIRCRRAKILRFDVGSATRCYVEGTIS